MGGQGDCARTAPLPFAITTGGPSQRTKDSIDGIALDGILYRKARMPVESVAALVTSLIAARH